MTARSFYLALFACAGLLLSGCGERPQVVNFKQGTYQGKPDTPAYQNELFNGDKAAWNRAVNTRVQGQNEYVRVGGVETVGGK